MRIKSLFSIPDGEKVTEKALRKVLISSICAILLCMTCLVSTTWAWFAVDIENKDNTIQIAQWSLDVTINNEEGDPVSPENGIYKLNSGKYSISIDFSSDAKGNDLGDRMAVYLVMIENDEQQYATSFELNADGGYEPIQKTYEVGEGEEATLYFYFTRMNPQIGNDLMTAVFEAKAEESDSAAEDDQGDTAGSTDGTNTTATTESSTESSSEPSAETTASTESTGERDDVA